MPGRRRTASTAATLLILCLTGCARSDPTPLPTVSPTGPTTPAVQPTPVTTTVGPTPITTSIARPTPIVTTIGPTTSSSPASTTTVPVTTQWTFLVVRHANWVDDGSDDPPLTEAGHIRARRLADLLSSRAGVAVYATSHRRAQDTARPTAVVWDVRIATYDVDLAPTALVSQIKRRHPTGLILIVGHSDTLPGIVGELCRCRVDQIPRDDYSLLFEVVQRSDGAVLHSDRVNY
jgi:phosphohistidine phosphatase SixA